MKKRASAQARIFCLPGGGRRTARWRARTSGTARSAQAQLGTARIGSERLGSARLRSGRARGHLRVALLRLRSPPSPSLRVPGSAEPRARGSGHIHAAPVSPLSRRRAPAATEHGAGGAAGSSQNHHRGWKGLQETIESTPPLKQVPYRMPYRC
ncbi:uncharacterized protein LOC110395411 isoform X2 [Numida meleagris]|uniref:uncharacterized protein LOC110395411 isoform X2 n=1 Tax=Numida meleagris TaxID=8996 RepID=UPI000B3E2882|nr:uncharacterized protein LOC110395411 isoform X2 [Numida meleagris]